MRLFASLTATAVIAALACPSHAEPSLQESSAQANGTGTITIHWTAPGDDSLTGTAAVYDMRCSPIPLTTLNFNTAQYVARLPKPHAAGTKETFTVSGLVANLTYYIAIKTADAAGNWSRISNVITKVAVGPVGVSPEGVRVTDLSKPWPNPARSVANFAMSLASPGDVQI